MTFQVSVQMSSGCSQPGRDWTGRVMIRTGDMKDRTAAQQTTLPPRSRLPYIPNLAKSTDGVHYRTDGCPNLTKSLLATKKQEAGGRHFLFDKTYEQIQRTRTLIPPLPRNYHVHRSEILHPISLSKDLSHSQVRPLSLGTCAGYNLGTSPSFLLPSALVLNKRNTFSVDNCHLNRPKVSQRAYNLLTIKDIRKEVLLPRGRTAGSDIGQFIYHVPSALHRGADGLGPGEGSYPDPMAGAPHSFLHRVSELSTMAGDTARQEKLGKMTKHRKQESF